jgi:hypothetical protein
LIKLAQNKVLIVLLMLVAFIGQAMVSTAMSYANVTCAHEINADMAMMIHDDVVSGMANEAMNHASMMSDSSGQEHNQATMDCCQEQCQCPMNGCVSLSLLANTSFNALAIAEQKIPQLTSLHASQINASLYRPPIS